MIAWDELAWQNEPIHFPLTSCKSETITTELTTDCRVSFKMMQNGVPSYKRASSSHAIIPLFAGKWFKSAVSKNNGEMFVVGNMFIFMKHKSRVHHEPSFNFSEMIRTASFFCRLQPILGSLITIRGCSSDIASSCFFRPSKVTEHVTSRGSGDKFKIR